MKNCKGDVDLLFAIIILAIGFFVLITAFFGVNSGNSQNPISISNLIQTMRNSRAIMVSGLGSESSLSQCVFTQGGNENDSSEFDPQEFVESLYEQLESIKLSNHTVWFAKWSSESGQYLFFSVPPQDNGQDNVCGTNFTVDDLARNKNCNSDLFGVCKRESILMYSCFDSETLDIDDPGNGRDNPGECTNDEDCDSLPECANQTCICEHGRCVRCPQGSYWDGAQCDFCQENDPCNCPDGQVADGRGSCRPSNGGDEIDPGDFNPDHDV